MLVLNTNEQGNLGELISNSMFRAYPDFKSLILFPNIYGAQQLQFNGADNRQKDAILYEPSLSSFEVNSTKVNVGNQPLNELLLLTGGLTGGDIGSSTTLQGYFGNLDIRTGWNKEGTITDVIRLGIPETLEGGEIIGKKIITSFGRTFQYNSWSQINSQSNLSMKMGIVYRIGLLHSDGSITYGDRIEPPEYLSPEMRTVANDSNNRYCGAGNRKVENATNGFTAVAGDRVIFELGVKLYYSGLSSNIVINPYYNIYFGKKGTGNDTTMDYNNSWTTTNLTGTSYLGGTLRGRPIQISIE